MLAARLVYSSALNDGEHDDVGGSVLFCEKSGCTTDVRDVLVESLKAIAVARALSVKKHRVCGDFYLPRCIWRFLRGFVDGSPDTSLGGDGLPLGRLIA